MFFSLKRLSERHSSVRLACLSAAGNEEARKELARYFQVKVIVHAAKKPSAAGAVHSLFRRTPYIVSRNHSPLLLETVFAMMDGVDLVQVEGIHAAWYGTEVKKRYRVPVVLRLHNLESANLGTYLPLHPNPLVRSFLRMEWGKLLAYERLVCGMFDRVAVVSHDDERRLREIAPSVRTEVIPVGVDTASFHPRPEGEEPGSVLWLGSLQWLPNRDSLSWFLREILPVVVDEVPSVKVRVAGSGSGDLKKKLHHPNVDFLGEVEDIRPLIAASQVCIVPLRAGSGMRMKTLEFLAMGKAVVSTTLGAQGLGAVHGTHLICADEPSTFAQRIVDLLGSPGLREQLGREGRAFVEKRYSWDRVADAFERLYNDVGSL
ncbi:MAG: hypothetical protein HBSIN02_07210 [Bacteroidia bacterium]|nr:MAG: hypothetical protein HBSIN02_07210 [Bacteroidia bacterium]